MFQMDVLQRAGLPEQQCAALQEAWTHCGKIYQRPLHDQIQITCVGLYNAGKSTLLNAITQSDYFPTGDIPTTREIAVYKQKNCAYVDTPGLNANPNDDSTTQKALEDTDLLVFVSCIQNGGLTSAEAQWLRRARQIFGSDARMKERTLFVISQCGRMEETGVEKVVHKYRQDIKKVLNFYLESLYPLDVHIWQSGVEQNEPDLKNFSKFDIFKQALKRQGDMVQKSLAANWQKDRRNAVQQVQNALQALQESCQALRMNRGSDPQIVALKQKVQDFKTKADTLTAKKPSLYAWFSISYNFSDLQSCESKNRYTAKQDALNRLKRFASRCLSEAKSELRKERSNLIKKYSTSGNGSIYFDILNDLNEQLENIYIDTGKIGIELPAFQEINCAPKNFDSIYSWIDMDLRIDQFESANYYVDWYKDKISCDEWFGKYVKTLFGEIQIPTYKASAYSAAIEIEDRIREEFKNRIDDAEQSVQLFFSNFSTTASKEAKQRADAIEQQIKSYECSIIEKAEASIHKAEIYLGKLEQEAQKWKM